MNGATMATTKSQTRGFKLMVGVTFTMFTSYVGDCCVVQKYIKASHSCHYCRKCRNMQEQYSLGIEWIVVPHPHHSSGSLVCLNVFFGHVGAVEALAPCESLSVVRQTIEGVIKGDKHYTDDTKGKEDVWGYGRMVAAAAECQSLCCALFFARLVRILFHSYVDCTLVLYFNTKLEASPESKLCSVL